MELRSPIVCVLGHVDHGKTSVLDRVRGTAVAAREPGLITQHVGASFVPSRVIEEKYSGVMQKYGFKLTIPGLLFIDTPGHEAFANLRRRGGAVADLAVLVVDVTQSFQPQTVEAVEVLRSYKTPFIVAANKIDLVKGWVSREDAAFTASVKEQRESVKNALDEKVYEIVAELGKLGFDAERFDRVTDLKKQVVIIPVSAKTGEGFPELLAFLAGLTQRFMEKRLKIETSRPAVGTVLEVKDTPGLGVTIDAVIFEGCVNKGDRIAVASLEGPLVTKIKAILLPAPLEEIRDPRKKFKAVEKACAAAGLKIAAPSLERVIPGSPLLVAEDEQKALREVAEELEKTRIARETTGAVVKADALGSLEALAFLLEKQGIRVRRAEVGVVSKKDVLEAEAVRAQEAFLGVVFAFNARVSEEARRESGDKNIKIFESNIIYKLLEDYAAWKEEERLRRKREQLEKFAYPAKLRVMPGFVFRASKPAIVGIEVVEGILKPKAGLMRADGRQVGAVQSIQSENRGLEKAEKGSTVAVSIEGGVYGRNFRENDLLYTTVPKEQAAELEKRIEEKSLLKEIMQIMQKAESEKK